MLNIGAQELLLILVIALLVVGPRRLPELGRSLGKGIRELRKAQDEVRKTLQVNLDAEERPAYQGRRAAAGADATRRKGEPTGPGREPTSGQGAADDQAGAPGDSPTSEVGEVSRSLGRGLAELRRAREEIQRSFRVQVDAPASAKRRGEPRTRRSAPPSGSERAGNDTEPAGPGDGATSE